jgi:hypothetical protein
MGAGPQMDDATKQKLLAGLRQLADGHADGPHAASARAFLGDDVDEKEVPVVAQQYAKKLAAQLGVDLKALDEQREDIHARMGMSKSRGLRWEGHDRVFGALTFEEARDILERNARAGSQEASLALRSIRRRA